MDKRLRLTLITIFIWVCFGVLGLFKEVSLTGVSVYYVALTGFVLSYVIGEGLRPSEKTAIGVSGPNSKREMLIYITIVLWAGLGIYGIFKKADFTEISTYFSVLTPFVSAYILGETFKKSNALSSASDEIQKNINKVVDVVDKVEKIIDKTPLKDNEVINKIEDVVDAVKEELKS